MKTSTKENVIDIFENIVDPDATYYVSGLTIKEDGIDEEKFVLVRPSATPWPYVTTDKTRLYSTGHHSALYRVDLTREELIKEHDKHFAREEVEPEIVALNGLLRASITKSITTGINFLR